MQLKLFTDLSFLPEGHWLVPLLRPFWNGLHSPSVNSPVLRDLPYMKLSSIGECDFVVCPQNWSSEEPMPLAIKCYEMAKKAGKRFIIFSYRDTEDPLPFDDALIFRSGLRRSTKQPNTYACPAFAPTDLLAEFKEGRLEPRHKNPLPSVAFCGNVIELRAKANAWRKFWKHIGYSIVERPQLYRAFQALGLHLSHNDGRIYRSQALHCLEIDPRIKSHFIRRPDFWENGALWEKDENNHKRRHKTRVQFVDNILGSDYCCMHTRNWQLFKSIL